MSFFNWLVLCQFYYIIAIVLMTHCLLSCLLPKAVEEFNFHFKGGGLLVALPLISACVDTSVFSVTPLKALSSIALRIFAD